MPGALPILENIKCPISQLNKGWEVTQYFQIHSENSKKTLMTLVWTDYWALKKNVEPAIKTMKNAPVPI